MDFSSLLPHPSFIEPSIYNLVSTNMPSLAKKQFSPDQRLSIDSLKSVDKLSWLSGMDFALILKSDGIISSSSLDYTPHTQFSSIDTFFDFLWSLDCQASDPINSERPILAMDLETTGLDNRATFQNSKRIPGADIVGVVIAISDSKSFYLPVLHNESDDIPNWSLDDIKRLFVLLQDVYTLVWHNGAYDISVCTSNGIPINNKFNYCSLIATKALMMDEYDYSFKSNGLKFLSDKILGRPMIEINELFSLSKGSYISFETLPASNALVYAASDGANTYGIWLWANAHERSLINQGSLPFRLEMYSVYNTTALLDSGFQLDLEYLNNEVTDLLIQQLQIEDQFSDFDSVNTFTSSEKAGSYLANFILDALLSSGLGQDNALKFMKDKFGVKSTTVSLASGESKIKWTSKDEVLSAYLSNLSVLTPYLDDSAIEHLKTVINLITSYRSLSHTLGMFIGAIRNLASDDRGDFLFFTLKQNGTKTGRYSNGKTDLDRMTFSITAKTRKLSSSFKSSSCLFNAQGLPAFHPTYKRVVPLDNVPPSILKKYESLHKRARERLSWLLLKK